MFTSCELLSVAGRVVDLLDVVGDHISQGVVRVTGMKEFVGADSVSPLVLLEQCGSISSVAEAELALLAVEALAELTDDEGGVQGVEDSEGFGRAVDSPQSLLLLEGADVRAGPLVAGHKVLKVFLNELALLVCIALREFAGRRVESPASLGLFEQARLVVEVW